MGGGVDKGRRAATGERASGAREAKGMPAAVILHWHYFMFAISASTNNFIATATKVLPFRGVQVRTFEF